MESRISFHDQIKKNKWKSFFLLIIIFGVFILLGYIIALIAGPDYFLIIMIFSIIISILYILIGYYNSDKIALASVNARIVLRGEYPQYYHSVEGLCLASGMPIPRLYIMEDPNINAFASGRDPKNSVICLTTGALEKLNKQELEGVLSHELSHIANFDIRFMTLTAVLVGMIAIISEIFLRSLWFRGNNDRNKSNAIIMLIGILLAILAPIIVKLVQLSISRKREYVADATGVKLTRTPTGLINALKKIEGDTNLSSEKHKINKAIAPLFISDPFKSNFENAFSTHPSLKKRISILERM
jgi:heat shock protein HtpX